MSDVRFEGVIPHISMKKGSIYKLYSTNKKKLKG